MCAPSAPAPTPPRETSAAATGTNVSTAIANAFMTNMNETGPNGTRTFSQTGAETVTDPYTGQTYQVPRFSVETTLSPQQQAIKDQQDAASLNLSSLGANLSGQLGGQLTQNFRLGNEETEARLFELGRGRLDPMFAQRDNDLRTRLANQGIRAGTEAYDREMALAGQQENDAYNQLLLTGRGQASNELLTEDNQRINQIGALLSGGQVSQPMFQSGVGIQGAPTTDNASIIGNYDNQRMNQWQQTQAARGSAIGALGRLFSLSDERAKDDKRKIGETEDGLGIYSFKYKGSPKTEIGLMAHEVKKRKPGAVKTTASGLMAVDYGKALQ
jgi:hypothetical protein